MKLINNLQSSHYKELKIIAEGCDKIVLISPFLMSSLEPLFIDIIHPGIKEIKLITTLLTNTSDILKKADSMISLVDLCNQRNITWDIAIDNKLHGKIYMFYSNNKLKGAIVSSANLTESGLQHKHEWGMYIDDINILNDIESDIDSIDLVLLDEDDIIKLMIKVEDYYISNPKLEPDKIELDLSDILKKKIITIDETKYFIKPIGSNEYPFDENRFLKLYEKLHFSKRRPAAVSEGSILICYGVGTTKLLGVFKTISSPENTGDKKDRWPWFVKGENIYLKYSAKWNNNDLRIIGLQKEFNNKCLDEPVTFVGGDTLGALNFGSDKIRLSEKFAKFLINHISDLNK